ncbi:hypothetical protein M2401_003691 [Pseudomonas sp. JUb42]|uniref:Arc family DNA-binding protein n=1 Tax=Pseudomonas sp. JUb42 TaxID=2940611 RepID=UPI0021676557|nr:Arc family DNA-binding protein [Pseudomonas sp. JUb42]MCS3469951.1 hypothetical protein [Pseudomonas sp. JUb42]
MAKKISSPDDEHILTYRRRPSDPYILRFPDGMRALISVAAAANHRSMQSEIIKSLNYSFSQDDYVTVSSFEAWAASVKQQMVELSMPSFDAGFALEENEQWFAEQYEAGAGAGITADEWFNHHHTANRKFPVSALSSYKSQIHLIRQIHEANHYISKAEELDQPHLWLSPVDRDKAARFAGTAAKS